jgi:branched-chain amino acid transport system ATP-binding protein
MLMLELDNLTVRYGNITAVKSVSLNVHEGEIVALIGPNGAGKTSTFAAVMGLIPLAGGSVTYQQRKLHRLTTERIVRQGLTLVPEHRRLFKDLTVRENLRIGATARRNKSNISHEIDELFSLFPILRERAEQKAGYLSGGEAQQLAIARAVMSEPRLLLLDEPTLGLAPLLVNAIFELIQKLRERGFSILFAEQNAYKAIQTADRTYILRHGAVVAERDKRSQDDAQTLIQTYLGVQA